MSHKSFSLLIPTHLPEISSLFFYRLVLPQVLNLCGEKGNTFKKIAFPTYTHGESKCGRPHWENFPDSLHYPQHPKRLFFVLLLAEVTESATKMSPR